MNLFHTIGNVAGPALKTTASALDLVTPNNSALGKSAQSLYNAGANINNPNVVYSGNTNPYTAVTDGRTGFTAVKGAYTNTPSGQPTSGYDTAPVDNGYWVNGTNYGSAGNYQTQQGINDTRLQLDDQEGDLRRLLGSVDTQETQGLANINDSYNGELATGQKGYAQQVEDNTRNKLRALGQVDQGAYTANNSLRRLLGMSGSANQSALKFAAPNAIARDASQKRNIQVENYGLNDRNITTAKNKYETDLLTAKAKREMDFKKGIATQRQTLNNDLGDIAGQRASLNGGNYQSVRDARAPFKNQANAYQSTIDNLYNDYKGSLNVTPQQASLKDFVVDKSAIQANQAGGGGDYSPYNYFLKRKQSETTL